MIDKSRWLLVALSVIVALGQLGAVIHLLHVPTDLIMQTRLILPLELFAGAVWALLFSIAAVNLARKSPHAMRWNLWVLSGFFMYSAARLSLFAQADYDRNRLSLMVIVTTLLVGFVAVYAAKQTEYKE
jgi:hypothetical protein